MVEAFHKYNNIVDPETSLALVLDETNYTLIEFQRGEGFTRANFDQQGVAIAAFYVLVMGKFQRQGIDQSIQNKIRNLAQTSSEINEVELEINKILTPDYFSLNSLKRAAINLISGNNGYDVCYINDTGEKNFYNNRKKTPPGDCSAIKLRIYFAMFHRKYTSCFIKGR